MNRSIKCSCFFVRDRTHHQAKFIFGSRFCMKEDAKTHYNHKTPNHKLRLHTFILVHTTLNILISHLIILYILHLFNYTYIYFTLYL